MSLMDLRWRSVMPDKHLYRPAWLPWVAVISLAGIFLGVHFSRALVSVGSIVFWASALYGSIRNKDFNLRPIHWVLFALALLWALDGFRADQTTIWQKSFMIRIGFVFHALSAMYWRKLENRPKGVLFAVVVGSMLVISTASVIHYFLNREVIDEMLLRSKHVPLYSDLHHIQFSVYLALAAFLAFFTPQLLGWVSTRKRNLCWAAGVILSINLHILSSRTGLTAFWVAMGIGCVVWIYQKRSQIGSRNWVVIALIIALPVVGLFTIPSLHNKMENTIEDLNATRQGGKEINDKSFGMRMEAWRNALFIIQGHTFTGIGTGNQEEAMSQAYEERNTVLKPVNRIGIHNQYLEMTVTNGLIGLLLLLSVLFLLFRTGVLNGSVFYIAVWSMVCWSMLFESMIERQHGVFVLAFALFFFLPKEIARTTNNS